MSKKLFKPGDLVRLRDDDMRTFAIVIVWATIEDDETVVCELQPGEPVFVVSPIAVDPMAGIHDADEVTPSMYKVITRGGVGWVNSSRLGSLII